MRDSVPVEGSDDVCDHKVPLDTICDVCDVYAWLQRNPVDRNAERENGK